MKRLWGVLIVILAIVMGWRLAHRMTAAHIPAPTPTARVTVAPIRAGPVINRLVAYGRVMAAPWAVHALVEPFEVSVTRVLVNRGQSVGKGAALLVLSPGPSARMALLKAHNDYRLARLALKEEQTRVHLRLATRTGLLVAIKTFDTARLQLRIFKEEDLRRHMTVVAPVGGVVNRIVVQEGSTVGAGQPLMDIIAGDRLEVQLGVEPEDVPTIRIGESVQLSSFEDSARPDVRGLVSVISRVMNPATHMINVFVTLPMANTYLLGEYVEGRFTVVSPSGLLVARAAIVPSGHRFILYTVKNGHAVFHRVRLGPHNSRVVQVIDPHLHPGMPVVVLGNYELKPGMPVRVQRQGP